MRIYSIDEALDFVGENRSSFETKVYTSKTIKSFKIGNKRFITENELVKYIKHKEFLANKSVLEKLSKEEVSKEYREKGRLMAQSSHTKKK